MALFMRRNILFLIIFSFFWLLCPAQGTAAQQFIVVIDPGHGGGDPGTLHRKCKQDEKTIALEVSLRLGKLIKQKYPNVKVVYTRETDIYPTLPDRTRMAREAKGNLFISIHVNGAKDTRARGIETYVFGVTGLKGKSEAEQQRIRERTMIERENLDINGNQIDFETAVDIETKILCQAQREKHNKYSMEVAHYVQDNILSALRKSDYRNFVIDRGVKQKNLFVLCYSPMPAILIELGYMSNVHEEKFMNTDDAKDIYAKAIFQGFEQYHSNWKRRQLKEGEEEENILPLLAQETADKSANPAATSTSTVQQAIEQKQQEKVAPQEQKAQPAQQQTPVKQQAADGQQQVAVEQQTASPQQAVAQPSEPQGSQQAEVLPLPSQPAETQPPKPDTLVQKPEPQPAPKEPVKETVKQQEPATIDYSKMPVGTAVPMQPAKACFRIQFLSSTSRLKRGDSVLKGLWPVFCYQANGYYRYTSGEAKTRAELQTKIREIRKLYPDAFIVHFDEKGQRIP